MFCRVEPYEGSEPYIFLSYCHKDQARVYPIFEQMAVDGFRVWYDNGNHAGDDWPIRIEEALERSKVIVAFFSEASSLSNNCKSEVTYALKNNKKVLPILLGTEDLPKGMRMLLSYLHYLKAEDYSSDRALLAKLYEAEELKVCRGPGVRLLPNPQPERKQMEDSVVDYRRLPGYNSTYDEVISRQRRTEFKPEKEPVQPDTISGENKNSVKPEPDPKTDTKIVKQDPDPKTEKKIIKVVRKKSTKVTEEHVSKDISQKTESDQLNISRDGMPYIPNNDTVQDHKQSIPVPENKQNNSVPENKQNNSVSEDSEKTIYNVPTDDDATVIMRDVIVNPVDDDAPTVYQGYRSSAILIQPSAGKATVLKLPQTKIGRSALNCDVVIDGNTSISKHHADIIHTPQGWYLRDAGSLNGTYLNQEKLEAEKQVKLDNPTVFRLNDEYLVLITDDLAWNIMAEKYVPLLINEATSAVRVMDADSLALNRNNKWPDGTLADNTVHREAHARIEKSANGFQLINESPRNSTCVNDTKMQQGDRVSLSSGDRIRLGDNTVLKFRLITL